MTTAVAYDEFVRNNAARTRHYLEHGEWLSKEDVA